MSPSPPTPKKTRSGPVRFGPQSREGAGGRGGDPPSATRRRPAASKRPDAETRRQRRKARAAQPVPHKDWTNYGADDNPPPRIRTSRPPPLREPQSFPGLHHVDPVDPEATLRLPSQRKVTIPKAEVQAASNAMQQAGAAQPAESAGGQDVADALDHTAIMESPETLAARDAYHIASSSLNALAPLDYDDDEDVGVPTPRAGGTPPPLPAAGAGPASGPAAGPAAGPPAGPPAGEGGARGWDETLPAAGHVTLPSPPLEDAAEIGSPHQGRDEPRARVAASSADQSGAFAEVTPFLADRAFPELPSAPKVTSRAAPRPDVSDVRMSPVLFRAAIFGPLLGSIMAGWVGTVAPTPAIPIAIAVAMLVFAAGAQLSLVYHIWTAIQDDEAPLSAGWATWPLLIPVFNLYWVFRALPGYATAYNAFTSRYLLRVPRLSQNLILAAMVVPVLGIAVYWVVVGKLCSAVNAISAAPRAPASVRADELPPVAGSTPTPSPTAPQ